MSKVFWFLAGVVIGWVIIGILFPGVGEFMKSNEFLPAVSKVISDIFANIGKVVSGQ